MISLRQPIKLLKGLQFAASGRNWIKQSLGQPKRAETGRSDWFDTQPLPFGFQSFFKSMLDVVGDDRKPIDISGEVTINDKGALSVSFEDFPRVPVQTGCLRRYVCVLIKQSTERRPKGGPIRAFAAQPIRPLQPARLGR